MPKQILILDSTQIDAFLTCPQLWDYGQKQRLTPCTGAPTGEAMLMGTLGHKYLELYYKAKAEGKSQVQAIGAAESWDPDMRGLNVRYVMQKAMIWNLQIIIPSPPNPSHSKNHADTRFYNASVNTLIPIHKRTSNLSLPRTLKWAFHTCCMRTGGEFTSWRVV